MGPIVLLTGVLIVLYAVAALFAGGSVASATRGVGHSRRYALVTMIVGGTVTAAGLIMILQ